MRSVQLAPATPNGEKTDHILPVKSTKYYSFSMRLNPDRSLPTVRREWCGPFSTEMCLCHGTKATL